MVKIRDTINLTLNSGAAWGAWSAGIVPNKGAVHASQARPLNTAKQDHRRSRYEIAGYT
jgi:hypothetical protein